MKDHLGSLGFSQIYLGKQGELFTSPSGEKPELRIIAIEVRENSSSYGLRIGLCGNQRRGLFLKASQQTVKEPVKAAEKEPSSGLEAGGDLDAACLVGVVVIEDECASQDSKRSGGIPRYGKNRQPCVRHRNGTGVWWLIARIATLRKLREEGSRLEMGEEGRHSYIIL